MDMLENVLGSLQSWERTPPKRGKDSSCHAASCARKRMCGDFFKFVWTSEGDWDKIEAVEEKFDAHCALLISRHFNRFLFIKCKQHKGNSGRIL